jgi:hypothetical protein
VARSIDDVVDEVLSIWRVADVQIAEMQGMKAPAGGGLARIERGSEGAVPRAPCCPQWLDAGSIRNFRPMRFPSVQSQTIRVGDLRLEADPRLQAGGS